MIKASGESNLRNISVFEKNRLNQKLKRKIIERDNQISALAVLCNIILSSRF